MRRIVSEAELDSVDVREFHRIVLATDTANFIGEEIKSDLRMPGFVSANSPAPDVITNELFIVVEDPENPETIERVRRYVADNSSGI